MPEEKNIDSSPARFWPRLPPFPAKFWERIKAYLSQGQPAAEENGGGPKPASLQNPLSEVLRSCRSAVGMVGFCSGIVNLLMLTGAFFMLALYDLVLPSRSMPTLAGICILAAILFSAQGMLEVIRGRLLSRTGSIFDEELSR